MRLIDADKIDTFQLAKSKANQNYYHLMEQIINAPTVETIKQPDTIEIFREVLDRLGRKSGFCSGVQCPTDCPFSRVRNGTMIDGVVASCKTLLVCKPERVREIAAKWLEENPEKPNPTDAEQKMLEAFALVGYPWFAVDYNGRAYVYTDPPRREARAFKTDGNTLYAKSLEDQKFQTWEDEPRYTEVKA